MMSFPRILIVSSCLSALTCVATATDVAFNAPYRSDANTYLLCPFDAPDLSDSEGTAKIAKSEILGDAAVASPGKFGKSLHVHGKGAVRIVPAAGFPGGSVSIEAWIKLDRYPEKEAYIVCRPARSEKRPAGNVDGKGFALLVDAQGALHLETTNSTYRTKTRTSSPPGAVPLGRWVHVAGISDGFPIAFRRLYVDGRECQAKPLQWGEGLLLEKEDENRPNPIYIGNNERQDAGLAGAIDEVRIHTRTVKFWPVDEAGPSPGNGPVASGPPYFVANHSPLVELPLREDTRPTVNRVEGLKVEAGAGRFVAASPSRGWLGTLTISAPKLLDLHDGSIEFWLQPVGVNNFVDNNRTFVDGPFSLYFINDGGELGLKPMTLYFPAGNSLHFVSDGLGTEFHPGTWYHLLITWKEKTVAMYVNGRLAEKTLSRGLARPDNKGLCTRVQLTPSEPIGIFRDVRLYGKALLPQEAENAWRRYLQPEKLKAVSPQALELKGDVLPSRGLICYQCVPDGPVENAAQVRLTLTDEGGKTVLATKVPLSAAERDLPIPELPDGAYTLAADLLRADGRVEPGDRFTFARKHFPWEKNKLGLSGEIFPPLEPIRVTGDTVAVVGRTYTMNGFGLWDRVTSLGRDLLAGPIRLHVLCAGKEQPWTRTAGAWVSTKPSAAEYRATMVADALQVDTRSTIEPDGCMKVEMQLGPGRSPSEISRLWIEIPLRDAEIPLMHSIGDGVRQNYSGAAPAGEGVVWDGAKAARSRDWRNCFVPYVWLGAEERGLAWFGENDRGWVTEKGNSKTPTHRLVRRDGVLALEVYLVNRPIVLQTPRQLCFGLQASPTKPLPADWRRRLPDIPVGLAVVPFGGLQCPSQGPFRDDWTIVDKLLACREGKALDGAWLAGYVARNKPPLVHGTWNWADSVSHFATRARDIGSKRPLTVYQEEMEAAAARPEYAVFQDEWDAQVDVHARTPLDPASAARGYCTLGRSVDVTFGPSYRDFGCWFANEWFKRGVSLYWDNTYPHLATNPRTSDAYLTEDGEIQPCLVLWNQREYQKRAWNLLMQWRRQRSEPLEWVVHMTNTIVLPVHTWATADLDHELANDQPFSPEWLRTETTGRQIGNFPLSLYAVAGSDNKVLAGLAGKMSKEELQQLRARIEWGMRTVHEIQHLGPLDKYLTDFGYGGDRVKVHNYWDPFPALLAKPSMVKWLVLSDPAKKTALIVLASWSPEAVDAEISLRGEALGFDVQGCRLSDAETGAMISPALTGRASVKLTAPYGVRVLRVEERTFDVTAYGAVGDGAADDTPAIQRAIHAAEKAAGGGTVYFPARTYLLNSHYPSSHPWMFYNLIIGSNVTLSGQPGAKTPPGSEGPPLHFAWGDRGPQYNACLRPRLCDDPIPEHVAQRRFLLTAGHPRRRHDGHACQAAGRSAFCQRRLCCDLRPGNGRRHSDRNIPGRIRRCFHGRPPSRDAPGTLVLDPFDRQGDVSGDDQRGREESHRARPGTAGSDGNFRVHGRE